MTPFQSFYLWFSLCVFALAWLRGGHTERAGVILFILGYLATYPVHWLRFGQVLIGDAVVDLAFAGALIWLALRRDRWWTLAASAFAVLTMVVHAVVFLTPGLGGSSDVAARWGLGVMMLVALGGGVLECWLAGEPPVSASARWTRSSRPLP